MAINENVLFATLHNTKLHLDLPPTTTILNIWQCLLNKAQWIYNHFCSGFLLLLLPFDCFDLDINVFSISSLTFFFLLLHRYFKYSFFSRCLCTINILDFIIIISFAKCLFFIWFGHCSKCVIKTRIFSFDQFCNRATF